MTAGPAVPLTNYHVDWIGTGGFVITTSDPLTSRSMCTTSGLITGLLLWLYGKLGASPMFTILPDTGCIIKDVIVDNASKAS
jgi:hypothetical protein